MTIGERIKIARKATNMSQKELGEKLGITQTAVAQHENNLRKPKLDTVTKYAKALGVEISDLEPIAGNGEAPINWWDFYMAMKAHCLQMKAQCENCCMRLYCYTPPCEKTDSMMANVISFLTTENSCTGSENHSDHHTEIAQMPCPCSMDMSTALGYEPH